VGGLWRVVSRTELDRLEYDVALPETHFRLE